MYSPVSRPIFTITSMIDNGSVSNSGWTLGSSTYRNSATGSSDITISSSILNILVTVGLRVVILKNSDSIPTKLP